MTEKEHETPKEEHASKAKKAKPSKMKKIRNVCNITNKAQVALLIAVFVIGALAGYALKLAEPTPTGLACAAYDDEGKCIDTITPEPITQESGIGEVKEVVDNLIAIYAANAPMLAGITYPEPEYTGYGEWVASIPLPAAPGSEQTLKVTLSDVNLEIVEIEYLTSAVLPMPEEPKPIEFEKTEKPVVELFVMSYCPFGQIAVEAMEPVARLLGDKAIFDVHYVVYDNYKDGDSKYCIEDGQYCSMHGLGELNEDIRQLCVQKYQPNKFWDYILAVSSACNSSNVDECWEDVALDYNIDTVKIKQCQEEESVMFARSEKELNDAYGVRGSPTLVINGTEYQGDRSPEGYKQAVCSAFIDPPTECTEGLSTEGGAATGGCA